MERDTRVAKILVNWERLRRMGKLEPLLCDPPYFYRFTDVYDPWGSKERVGIEWIENEIAREISYLSSKQGI